MMSDGVIAKFVEIFKFEQIQFEKMLLKFCMYILMKRDMSAGLFFLCQISGLMSNYKSFNNQRSQKSKTIPNINTIILYSCQPNK